MLQTICKNGSEHRKAGQALKHLQDHHSLEAEKQLIEFSYRVSRKTGYILNAEVFFFFFSPGNTICLFLIDLLNIKMLFIRDF